MPVMATLPGGKALGFLFRVPSSDTFSKQSFSRSYNQARPSCHALILPMAAGTRTFIIVNVGYIQ
jgi:hypothetical protein